MRLSLLACGGLLAVSFSVATARAQETTTYQYDALGRLTRTAVSGGPNNTFATNYKLDKSDNRISVSSGLGLPANSNCSVDVVDYAFRVVPFGSHITDSAQIISSGDCGGVLISYSTQDGTALNGINYYTTSGTIALQDGNNISVRYSIPGLWIDNNESKYFYANMSVVSGNASLTKSAAILYVTPD